MSAPGRTRRESAEQSTRAMGERVSAALNAALREALEGRGLRFRGRHLFLLDVLSGMLAAYLALAIREDRALRLTEVWEFLPPVLVPLLVRPPIAYLFGLYRRVWRYASLTDLIQIAKATIAGTVISASIVYLVMVPLGHGAPAGFPRSFWISEGVLFLAMIGGARLMIRGASEWHQAWIQGENGLHRVPTLLYGAGQTGVIVARSAFRQSTARVRPVGFLDDDPARHGQKVDGLTVFGGLDDLPAAIATTNAQRLLITMPSADGPTIRRIVDAGLAAGLEVRTVPPLHELTDGSIDAFRARQVRVEDLLGRPLATEHAPAVDLLIRDRTILITGAGGSIGSELVRQVYDLRPRRIVLVDRAESQLYTVQRDLEIRRLRGRGDGEVEVHLANVVSRRLMARIIRSTKPDVIFHAAAYKHVPMMEDHPSESVQVNIGGTLSMLAAASAAGVRRFVFVSTDKAVEPSSVMGATKRIAEALVTDFARATGGDYVSVRFGNVLGSSGSVVPIFLTQLERGEALTVTDAEMTRYFMTIPEAGWLILDAAALGRSGDLFVLDMGEPVRILDLASDLIRLSGREPSSVPIQFTGLRPGEKLHEQLFYARENVQQTEVSKVLRTASVEPPEDLRDRVADLLVLAVGDQDTDLRESLFALVDDVTGEPGREGDRSVTSDAGGVEGRIRLADGSDGHDATGTAARERTTSHT
jgi:FlaA1/EpsC-like NDP-sugar epimerase